MDIQASLTSANILKTSTPLKLSQWLIGQVLSATVTARQSNNNLTLQIAGQQIEAKTNSNRPIQVGDKLNLFVEKKDNPTILRVIQHSQPEKALELKQQLLRENLPKQSSLDKLTQLINQISKNTSSLTKALPAPIERQIQKFIANLPDKSSLTNETGIKTVVKDSGLFLESKLLKAKVETAKPDKTSNNPVPNNQTKQTTLSKDLKANLLQLAAVVAKHKPATKTVPNLMMNDVTMPFPKKMEIPTPTKSAPPNPVKYIDISSLIDIETVSKQIESSIARIEVNQSKAIVSNDNPLPNWSVEIPVKDKQDIDLLKLEIQADQHKNKQAEDALFWSVNLNIEFDGIGNISARISIWDKEVSAALWSEQTALNDLIQNNLMMLEKQIGRCGLSTGKIECLRSSVSEQQTETMMTNLINIKI